MLSAVTPLMIGFFSGFHCIAMCGGLCAVICQKQNMSQTLLTNLGRVTTYTLLGVLFAGLVQGASLQLNLGQWGGFLRLLMGSMLILAGAVIIFKDRGKWLLIKKPLPFWPKVSEKLKRLQLTNKGYAVFLKGMLWGLIPCGLLYGMLVIAATTADILRGASFMLFFGLGTILPLLISQTVVRRLMTGRYSQWLRSISGSLIILLGFWIVLSLWFAHGLIPQDSVFFTELSAVLALCIP
ncbi:MAG: sulfite exporter TauE/SafE family protein, partial [Marinicella sp.]